MTYLSSTNPLRLAYGCADLYREPSSRRRARLIATAFELGVRHFDVAPMYGLGIAERELGRALAQHREHVVLATKFGIKPTAAGRVLGAVQGPIRAVLAAHPRLRQQAQDRAPGPGGAGSLLYRQAGYGRAAAEEAVQQSLRSLGTDHLDLLLLHDPEPGSVQSDDVCEFLEEAVQQGLLGSWGVAGEISPTVAVVERLSLPAPVVQVRCGLFDPAPSSWLTTIEPAMPVLFGVVGQAARCLGAHLDAEEGRRKEWSDRLGVDLCDRDAVLAVALGWAFDQSPQAVVLFSSVKEAHIEAACRVAATGPRAPSPSGLADLVTTARVGREKVAA